MSVQAADPTPVAAAEYLVRAFDLYPLVALSEWHGSPETMNFVRRLIRQPGFAGKVSDIAVEFGNARYQGLIDQYTAGEDVSRDRLKQVWENTTQVSGVWSSPIYEEFFADVRTFNQTVPAAKRIRVLLGDPPVDWTAVKGPADEDMNDWRDAHFAWAVDREVMKRRRKALLFIGGAHISRKVVLPNSLIHLLDRKHPGQTLVVSAVQVPFMAPVLGARLRDWPAPSVAVVRNTWLGFADVRDAGFGLAKGRLQDDIDAVLFLGPGPFSNISPRIDPTSDFSRELKRRQDLHSRTLPFRGGKIRFQDGSVALAPGSEAALEAVLAEMRRDNCLFLLIRAHADATEPQAQRLSHRRASFLQEWLAQRGVSRQRLATRGCGSSRPLWESDNAQHRSANRRADMVRNGKWAGCRPPANFDSLAHEDARTTCAGSSQ
jgi:outer membrane protein OmpA-like peptidoglycan-associated protein